MELTPFLNSTDSLAEQNSFITGYSFDSNNDVGIIGKRNIKDASISNAKIGTAAIGTANIGTLSFNQISGGTATLGGINNGNGLLIIKDSTGTVNLGSFSKDGFQFRDSTDSIRMIIRNDDAPIVNALEIGGSLGDGGLQLNAGTVQYANFSVDEFIFNKKLRLGGTDSIFGPDGGQTLSLQLYGTITANPVGTPGVNSCRIYVDNGGAGGKSRIMAQFDSGTPVVITAEP